MNATINTTSALPKGHSQSTQIVALGHKGPHTIPHLIEGERPSTTTRIPRTSKNATWMDIHQDDFSLLPKVSERPVLERSSATSKSSFGDFRDLPQREFQRLLIQERNKVARMRFSEEFQDGLYKDFETKIIDLKRFLVSKYTEKNHSVYCSQSWDVNLHYCDT